MASDATVHSYGTILEIYDAAYSTSQPVFAAANWVSIGCIHNISGPAVSITSTDSSCLTSAAATMTFIPGMVNTGEVTFTIDYTDDDEEFLASKYRLLAWWRIRYPDGGIDVFTAFITSHTRSTPFDDRITMDVTLKVTGVVDVTGQDQSPAD